MSLIRFSPRGLAPWFDDIDRWFDTAVTPARREPRSWSPGVDIVENEQKIVLKTDLPGMEEKDIEVKVDDNTLTITGERKFEKETKEENYHRVERTYGSFHRSFGLPETADADKISAAYNKGVLEVTIPKVQSKPKKVKVVDVK